MLEQVLDFISFAKYIIIAMGIIGLTMLIAGTLRKQRRMMMGGGYLLILSIIIWICGYFIISATTEKADRMIRDTYIHY